MVGKRRKAFLHCYLSNVTGELLNAMIFFFLRGHDPFCCEPQNTYFGKTIVPLPYKSPNCSGGKGKLENVPKVLLLELSLP